MIQVDVGRGTGGCGQRAGASAPAPATRLEAIRTASGPRGVEVTLAGNGPLLAVVPELTKDKPVPPGARFRRGRTRPAAEVTQVDKGPMAAGPRRAPQRETAGHPRRVRPDRSAVAVPGASRRATRPQGAVGGGPPARAARRAPALAAPAPRAGAGARACRGAAPRLRAAAGRRAAGRPRAAPQVPASASPAPQSGERATAVHAGTRSASTSRARTSARCCAPSRRISAPQHRDRPGGAGHGRRRAARRAVGPGARHHPARQQAGVRRRRDHRPDRAADRARRRRGPAPEAVRRAGALGRAEGRHAHAELRQGRGPQGPADPQRAQQAGRRAVRPAHQHADHPRPPGRPRDRAWTCSRRSTGRSRRSRSRRASSRRPATSPARSACSGA